jgi:predicted amidohydrolase
MNSHLRVTMVQAALAWQDPAANRRQLAANFRGLAGHTDLVVLPEMFSTGFTMQAEALAEEMDGPTIGWLQEEAASLGCVITGSLIVREGGRHYNRLVWARPDGTLEHYDKRHLFRMAREQEHYAAGTRRITVRIKGWRVCPMVCYDLRFPVWSRNRGDYDALVYVANWPARRANAWATLLRARAMENLSYVVGVNRVGTDGNGAAYAGDSVALDFLGQPLSSEGGGDRVETAVLDLESLQAFRASFPAHLDADAFDLAPAPAPGNP